MPHRREPTWATHQLTLDQAIAFGESEAWKNETGDQIAGRQLYQKLICTPFGVFHKAISEALGRDVYTHEFGWMEELQDEFEGLKGKPNLDEILGYLDPASTMVINVEEEK